MMTTGAASIPAALTNTTPAQGALEQAVGAIMLKKSMDMQKSLTSAMLYATLPASQATPHLGTQINTYA